jgi:antitoxin (DNA-binding transcriptional repressor) of toxin-antitoxin stability system
METAELRISIGELKARPAYAIAKARAGIKVQITSHRKTVAQLVAADADVPTKLPAKPAHKTASKTEPMTAQEAVRLLRAAGVQVTEGVGTLRLGEPIKLPPLPDGKTMSDLVSEMRGPR